MLLRRSGCGGKNLLDGKQPSLARSWTSLLNPIPVGRFFDVFRPKRPGSTLIGAMRIHGASGLSIPKHAFSIRPFEQAQPRSNLAEILFAELIHAHVKTVCQSLDFALRHPNKPWRPRATMAALGARELKAITKPGHRAVFHSDNASSLGMRAVNDCYAQSNGTNPQRQDGERRSVAAISRYVRSFSVPFAVKSNSTLAQLALRLMIPRSRGFTAIQEAA